MQVNAGTNTPLGANEIYSSGWQRLDPDLPLVSVVVSTDQTGVLTILEQNIGGGSSAPVVTAPVSAGASGQCAQGTIRGQFFQVRYVNGPTAQGSFSLTYSASLGQPEYSQQALLWMILKELRAISMLLAGLKEPAGSTVNIPFGDQPAAPL